ncbi:SPFH domain-containing protein [Nocardia sp. CDC160]|uniref:SPFH domain-containing protein n=1 Tax=Nocardia sp. CDC160 TaxID=3112166 RepID=UPI002DBF6341|nr:SPFH domain-containing protein [Nocardia sp. CDC160]MEC3920226.1 SPFH domain-containing protein [Nocardia sp. CDC160]
MAWLDREFIAVPDDRKNQLVYKWPDVSIRRYSRAIVNADETALLVTSGHVVAALGPGRHRIDTDELPGLGALIDTISGGRFYRAELYFVSTREFPAIKFGGRIADIADPISEQVVTLRVFGEFALSVRDPTVLLTSLAGTADLSQPATLESWCAEILLKAMKVVVTQGISGGKWQVLGMSAQLGPVENEVVRSANLTLYEYGLRIPRLGNFDLTLAPEDADRLKRLAKDLTYIRLAGDFQRYAAGELALGASQGLAHGESRADGNLIGTTLGLNAIRQNLEIGAGVHPASVASSEQQVCMRCRTVNAGHARFCIECGEKIERRSTGRRCRCGNELPTAARFCPECGQSVD